MHLTCTLAGEPLLDQTYSVGPEGDVRGFDVDADAECAIIEESTGGATAVTYPLGTTGDHAGQR